MIIMVVMTGTHPYSPLYDILNVILYTLYYNDMIITIIIHHHTTIIYTSFKTQDIKRFLRHLGVGPDVWTPSQTSGNKFL
jgi:hypothetical protein